MLPKIQLFSAYHKAFPILPKADYVTPIQSGAIDAAIRLDMLGDNTGENISHLGSTYNEITVAYWVLKNADRSRFDAWGLCQYRRYFIQDKYKLIFKKRSRYSFRTSQEVLDKALSPALYLHLQNLLVQNDVIVQKPAWANKENGIVYGIKDAYTNLHIKEHYDVAMEVVIEKFPDFAGSIESYGKLTRMSYHSMMIARWNIWDEYMYFLMTVLTEVKLRIVVPKEGYQSRVEGFLAERLHNLYMYHHQLKQAYVTIGLFEDKL